MRMKTFSFFIAAFAALASASVNTDITDNGVDTVLKVVNGNSGGQGYAILAKTASANGNAIRGLGTGYNGSGVWGSGSGNGPYATGVYGDGGNGRGVWGVSNTVGVYGEASTSGSAGVKGVATGTTIFTAGYGVYGEGGSAGVYGTSSSTGIWGNGSTGVLGTGGTGVAGEGYNGVSGHGIGESGSGVYGYSDDTYTYGVQGYSNAYGGIGIYGISDSPDALAGFFYGDVVITGSCSGCTVSDEKLKKNVRDLKGSLTRVLALRPKAYEMKNEEYKGKMILGNGTQIGLIAQELEKVVPEVVHSVKAPAILTPEERKNAVKKSPEVVKAVNYSALVPLLIAAIQEQQAEIEALKAGR